MKVVYVFTGLSRNLYFFSLIISAISVRRSNPNLEVVLVTDMDSYRLFQNYKSLNIIYFDLIIKVSVTEGNEIYKSRYLKTSLGKYFNEPFIFLDSDTLVRKKIDLSFLSENIDLAFCENLNRKNTADQINKKDFDIIKKLGIENIKSPYLNSGFIYSSSSKLAKDFFHLWHFEWKKSVALSGKYVDQPSLYSVLDKYNFNFFLLSSEFNSQVKSRLWFDFNTSATDKIEYDPIVWHFYLSTNEKESITQFEELCHKMVSGYKLKIRDVDSMIFRKTPWNKIPIFDSYFQKKLLKSSKLLKSHQYVLSGQYFNYFKIIFKQLMR